MAELISMTYEQARAEHFKTLKDEAMHKMNYWATRVRRSRPNDLNDPAHIRAGEYAAEYSYYKDALEALEDNRFQYETGFVKGFESAQPKWISVEERLPDVCDLVLVIASGQPKENIELYDAILIASYWGEEGWIADGFDGWDKLNVSFWMELPEGPKEGT